tara:strand:- start:37 stop:531 length:495 start_codon:yes stop_codon:yes gene_type:complete
MKLKYRLSIGDRVRHVSNQNKIGIVTDFGKRNGWIMIDWSDSSGIMFRKSHYTKIIKIEDSKRVIENKTKYNKTITTKGEKMSRLYNEKTIGSIGVDDEGNWGQKTGITVKVDSYEKVTIRFGNSYTLRINEEDVDALRDLLNKASVELMNVRYDNMAESTFKK